MNNPLGPPPLASWPDPNARLGRCLNVKYGASVTNPRALIAGIARQIKPNRFLVIMKFNAISPVVAAVLKAPGLLALGTL